MNILTEKIINQVAILSHHEQIKKVRKWGDDGLADKMERMTISVEELK